MDKNNAHQSLHIIDDRSEKNKESEYIFNFNVSSGNPKINLINNLENKEENNRNVIEKMPYNNAFSETIKNDFEKYDYISPNFNHINSNYNLYNLFYSYNAL